MSDGPLNESLPALRKPNEVLVMISKEKGMTAVARKLYTVLLWEAQQQMKALGRVPEATHLFEMPLRRALLLAGSSTESRTIAQGYLREMRKMAITWEAPGATNGPEWRDMALLSQAAFEMRHGERLVQWAFPPDLVKALLDPKLWTLQDLPIRQSPAKRLPEQVSCYFDRRTGVEVPRVGVFKCSHIIKFNISTRM